MEGFQGAESTSCGILSRTLRMADSQKNNPAPSAKSPVIRGESATGDLRLHEFRSRIFQNTRFLRVWLPPEYDHPQNASHRYPVFYLNDGQNLFEPISSFNGTEWQVDETADRLIRESIIAPMIFVGIDNAGKDRMREYMPHRSLNPMLVRVLGSRYPTFLSEEVMPFMARNYRISIRPEHTALGGSSLGALISLYTAAVRPDLIGRLLIESPSLWVSNRQMIRQGRGVRRWPQRIFLGTGTAESGRPDKDQSMVDDVRELASIFRRAGVDDQRLKLVVDDGATHHESAWARRFPEALSFLFGDLR
jgi:predicted alpha/beta superfamily hydrolase